MINKAGKRPRNDRLTQAAFLLSGAAVFCLLALLLVAGYGLLRPDAAAETACRQIVRQYGLHAIALMPAGRNARHPDGRLPGVDLRYDPRLPLENPDAGLVFPARPARFSPSPELIGNKASRKGAQKPNK